MTVPAQPTTAIPIITSTQLEEVLDDHEAEAAHRPPSRLVSTSWAVVSAVVMAPVAFYCASPAMLVPLIFLAAALGYLAHLDALTRTIKNKHTVIVGTIALLMLVIAQIVAGLASFVLAAAVIGAVVVFVTLLGIALTGSNIGGGDIKLSPVPAAILTVVSPIAAVFWLMFSLVFSLIGMIAAKLTGSASTTKGLPMVPFMAAAAPVAVLASWALSSAAGIYTGII